MSESKQSLSQWLSWMEQQHPKAIDLGLERVSRVWQALGQPEVAKKIVTVGGTNGKGSTVTYLRDLCCAAGYRVGVYTSPHFLRYNERIWLEGNEVSDEALCEAFETIHACSQKLDPQMTLTYFEMGTLAALWLLARESLDLAILEVGLGGRLDAVNIIDADIAVLTSIDIDHADWLGTDRENIGYEKAGIFRPGALAICAEPDMPASIARHASMLGAQLIRIGEQFGISEEPEGYRCFGVLPNGAPWFLDSIEQPGLPVRNMAPALQAASWLGMLPASVDVTRNTLKNASLRGRFQQVFWQGRHWMLDVAHNPEAARHMAQWLKKRAPERKVLALCGMLADKDCKGVFKALISSVSHWQLIGLDGPRGQTAVQLEGLLQTEMEGHSNVASHSSSSDLNAATKDLIAISEPEDLILVFGSFVTVTGMLGLLESQPDH
ncbi:bifunctional tetrahydrofolate synthase/dihydrofolate synthase [Pokkaliibacter sp. CJK22405]|uniref:bifunctional tetrahydrofolate synthase/dihydrofolate synthase n=1 Tax=Pokkaliibacter sp. CJK22405 TaxID=3384615 RepID=UPI0039856438